MPVPPVPPTPPAHASCALGLHHVTAISGDAQRTLDFYAGMLGLRLVKRTVNFDDPGSYHFYFGDATGTPGAILTLFPWGARAARGRPGTGQTNATALAVPAASLGFWVERLVATGVPHTSPARRTVGDAAETVLTLDDPDGLRLELVADPRAGALAGWTAEGDGAVPAEHAVRGLWGVTLLVNDTAATGRVLADTLGMRRGASTGGRTRYETRDPDTALGRVIDVCEATTAAPGRMGAGAVHHVAFRAGDDAGELALRGAVTRAGLAATSQIDRQYFRSVYFREPGGVLFELATDTPGFLVDEPVDALGRALQLPPRYEPRRAEIARRLPPLVLPYGPADGVPEGSPPVTTARTA